MRTVLSWVSVLPAPGWRPWYYSYTFPFVYLLLVSVPCLLSFSLSSLVLLIPSLRVLVLPGLDWAYWIRTEWGMRGMRIEWVKRPGNLGNSMGTWNWEWRVSAIGRWVKPPLSRSLISPLWPHRTASQLGRLISSRKSDQSMLPPSPYTYSNMANHKLGSPF